MRGGSAIVLVCTDGVGAVDTGGSAAYDNVLLILINVVNIVGGVGASSKVGEVFRLVRAAAGNALGGVVLGSTGEVQLDDRGKVGLLAAGWVVRLQHCLATPTDGFASRLGIRLARVGSS